MFVNFILLIHLGFFFFLVFFSDLDDTKAENEPSVFKQKKNFKIWFSPRSRKVRCLVEKPSEASSARSRSTRGAGPAKSGNLSAQPGVMSIFNFTSSSQDSGSSSSPKSRNKSKKRSSKRNASSRETSAERARRATRSETKETMKRNKLEAINQQWGTIGKTDSPNKKGQASAEGVGRFTKRVSFLSPADTSDDPQPEVPQASSNDSRPDTSTMQGNPSESSSVPNEQTQSHQNLSPSVIQRDAPSVHVPSFGDSLVTTHDYVSPLKRPSETCKADDKVTTLQTTPKRPRVSPARGRKSQISPSVLNPSASPGCDKKKRTQRQCDSPPVQRSPCSQRSASGSPAVLKRNHKGETPLHIASIKVRNSRRSALVSPKSPTAALLNAQMT